MDGLKGPGLPLHRNGRAPGASEQFAKAMSKGLNLVGMAKTKGGSDDKEVAYVLRQNSLLRIFACLVLFIVIVGVVLFSTILELSVVRRGLVRSEVKHHRVEKAEHMDFIRSSLDLQHALELEVHEHLDLEEFKAHFQKSMGSYRNNVVEILNKAQVAKPVNDEITAAFLVLNADLQEGLGKLIHKFLEAAKKAKEKLKTVSSDIAKDIDAESKEEHAFKEKMEEFGTDPYDNSYVNSSGDNEDEDSTYNEDGSPKQEPPPAHAEEGKSPPPHVFNRHDRMVRDEGELTKQLESFFAKLNTLNFHEVAIDTIKNWEEQLDKYEQTLEDDSKEADSEAVLKRFSQGLPEDMEKYSPAVHDSVVDYMTTVIEKAKVRAHKQEMLDLYNGWKASAKPNDDGSLNANRISAYTVLASMERLAGDNDLFLLFEWLENMDPAKPGEFKYSGEEAPGSAAVTNGEATPVTTMIADEKKTM